MPNPFFYGGAIHYPRYFVGRSEELRQIFAALRSLAEGREAQHVNIYGPKRIGKSSLLIRVQQSAPDRGLGAHPFLYLDAEGVHHPQAFYRELLALLGASGEPEPFAVKRALQSLPAQPVLLLDELGAWLKHPERFPDAFYNTLRAWMNEGLLACVVVSPRPLAELREGSPLSSPFFNIFGTVISLGPLPPDEAEALLQKGRVSDRPFTAEEIAWLKRWAREGDGYHPAKLQLAARELYEAKAHPPVDLSVIEARLTRQWKENIQGRVPQPFSRRMSSAWNHFLRWPAPLGRAVAEMLGREKVSPSTEIMLGWILLFLLLVTVAGQLHWGAILRWLLNMSLNP